MMNIFLEKNFHFHMKILSWIMSLMNFHKVQYD